MEGVGVAISPIDVTTGISFISDLYKMCLDVRRDSNMVRSVPQVWIRWKILAIILNKTAASGRTKSCFNQKIKMSLRENISSFSSKLSSESKMLKLSLLDPFRIISIFHIKSLIGS